MEALPLKIFIGFLIAGGLLGVHYVADRPIPESYLSPVIVTPAPSLPPIMTPTPQPTYQPVVTPIPVVRYVAPQPTLDPDPDVACTIPVNCGGGIEKMGTRECSQLTCCQVGSSWTLYTSQALCTDAQNKESSPSLSVHIDCPTKFGTVPVYGDNYGDALSQCETFQAQMNN